MGEKGTEKSIAARHQSGGGGRNFREKKEWIKHHVLLKAGQKKQVSGKEMTIRRREKKKKIGDVGIIISWEKTVWESTRNSIAGEMVHHFISSGNKG